MGWLCTVVVVCLPAYMHACVRMCVFNVSVCLLCAPGYMGVEMLLYQFSLVCEDTTL